MARLLLVEDDDAIAAPLERALAREDHEVVRTASGEHGLELALSGTFEVVVLDLGLPDLDGLEVCRRLREAGSTIGVLMLTARGDELDRVVGLDVGADDYLTKPFSLAELAARLRSLLRRASAAAPATGAPAVDAPGALRVDLGARRVRVGGQEVALTMKEFDLLSVLHREQGRVVPREKLMAEVWDEHWFGSTKTLDVTVARLRTKLEEHAAAARVETARGVGFRLGSAIRVRERLLAAFLGLTFLTVMLYGVPRAVARASVVADEAQADLRRSALVVAEAVQLRRETGLPLTGSPLAYLDAQDSVLLRAEGREQVLRGGADGSDDDLLGSAPVEGGGEVEVRRPRAVLRDDVVRALAPIVLSGLASLAVAAGAAFLLAARLARPFQQLAERAATLGRGSLDDLPPQPVREAEAIAAALRDSSAQVEAMLRREREFARNASHQLRTPLTGMRLRVEDLTMWPETPAPVVEELEHVLEEVDRLSDIVTALLALAREEQLGAWREVALGDVVGSAVARWQSVASQRGRTITTGRAPADRVPLPRVAIDQVLDVLVDNALSHGAGTVVVEAEPQAGGARFLVRDEGDLQVADQDLFRRRRGPGGVGQGGVGQGGVGQGGVGQGGVGQGGVGQGGVPRGGEGIGLALCAELAVAVGGSLTVVERRPTTFALQVRPQS